MGERKSSDVSRRSSGIESSDVLREGGCFAEGYAGFKDLLPPFSWTYLIHNHTILYVDSLMINECRL